MSRAPNPCAATVRASTARAAARPAPTVRATAAVVVAIATLAALAGCGKADADAIRAEFAGRPGVIEARTSCNENLPFAFSCDVTVDVERDITADELAAILPLMRTGLHGANRSAIEVEWGAPGYPNLEITFDDDGFLAPGISDTSVAAAFVEGIADPRVTEFVLDHFAPGVTAPRVTIAYDNPEPSGGPGREKGQNHVAIASMHRVQELIPGASVELSTPDLAINAPDGSAPEAELDLYLAIARAFPVQRAQVENGLVQIRLPDGTDPAPVQQFAEQQPPYASIDFVSITADDSLYASDVDPERTADLNAVIEAARALPQNPSASVQYDRVSFTVPDPEAARAVDAALSALPEYQRVGVRYSDGDMTVGRLPGGMLAIDQAVALAAEPPVAEVEITQRTHDDGRHHVDVDGVDNASPYDLGVALARSGVADLRGAWVVVSVRGEGRWVVSFYTDEPLRLEADRWLTRAQADEFTRGWEAGR